MKKVLVVRFSSIGDVVLTSPILRALKSQMDAVEIHYLTKKSYEGIVANNPNVAKVYTIEKHIASVLPELKKEKYDFVIDLHHNIRTKRLKLAIASKSSSFPKLNIRKFFLTQFKINKLPKIHVVDRYFKAVKTLGVVNDHQGIDFFIPAGDKVKLKDFNLPEKFIAFAIGAKFATKRLPDEKLVELIKKIKSIVVLLGGETDKKTAEVIANTCSNVIDLTGQLNLNQSASIIQQAQKVISHDTGLMHIAAAFEKQIISIWGNTVPDLGMYPYMPKNETSFSIHEVNHLKCRPCSKIGHDACPKKHFACMMKQDLEGIAREADAYFK